MRRLFGRKRRKQQKQQLEQQAQPQQQQERSAAAAAAAPAGPQSPGPRTLAAHPIAFLPRSASSGSAAAEEPSGEEGHERPPRKPAATVAATAEGPPAAPRLHLYTSPSGRQLWLPAPPAAPAGGPSTPPHSAAPSLAGGVPTTMPPQPPALAAPEQQPGAALPGAKDHQATQHEHHDQQQPQPQPHERATEPRPPPERGPRDQPQPPAQHPQHPQRGSGPTPFLNAHPHARPPQPQPLPQPSLSYPYPGAAGPGGGMPRGAAASRASSVTGVGTAAGTALMSAAPYGGPVDLDLDVAVVGAGVAGLATALALKRVHPRLRVKVFDRRPAPPPPDRKYGSYCRLEPNGMRAAAALDARLHAAISRHGLRARPVLVHDTDGSLITRLEERGTAALRRFGEPHITIGWYELEQALLALLPPGAVQYGAQYLGHRERDDGVYIAFRPAAGSGKGLGNGVGSSTAGLDQQQQHHHQQHDEQHQQSQADSRGRQRARQRTKVKGHDLAAAAAAAAAVIAAPAPALVRCGFMVAADGPFSEVRRRVVRDGDPFYDGVVKWLGRLPGDDVPALPLDFNAVWLSPGRTFLSHSLAGGDVAWEAVVTEADLRQCGFRYNTATRRVERLATPPRHTPSLRTEQSLGLGLGARGASRQMSVKSAAGGAGRRPPYGALEDTARRLFNGGGGGGGAAAEAPASAAEGGEGGAAEGGEAAELMAMLRMGGGGGGGGGEMEGVEGVEGVGAGGAVEGEEEDYMTAGGGPGGQSEEEDEEEEDARGKGETIQRLLALFGGFPAEVRAMLRNSRPSGVLEAGTWVRRAAELPAALGRGRLVILGEAAHPMRPSSQEENQALEDAAVLGACVQRHGLNKEALRRYEAERKPRWRHVMQLAMAANSTPSATSSGLSAALLDYNSALHAAAFQRLRPPLGWRLVGGLRRAAGLALMTGATLFATLGLTLAIADAIALSAAGAAAAAAHLTGAAGGLWLGAAELLLRSGRLPDGAERPGPLAAAAGVVAHLRDRLADASTQASQVAGRTGSVAAGIHAAIAAPAAPAAPPPAAHKPPRRWAIPGLGWRRRQREKEAEAEASAAAAARAAEETQARPAPAQVPEPALPWWRLDHLARRAKQPIVQTAAAVAVPAVVVVEGAAAAAGGAVSRARDAVVGTKDLVVDKVEDAAAAAAAAAAGTATDVASKAVQKRIARSLGAF